MWKKISWTIACAAIVAIALVANDQGQLAGRDDPSWLDRSLSEFGVVDALMTNFHLPESTLLMLVSAFVGREQVLDIYRDAIERDYRFFSFGDAMLVM